MPQCAALGCNNRSGRSKGKTFHRFPTDVERRVLWIRALKREGFQPGKNARLCGDHFEERCFIHTGKLRLREDAVPSVFSFSAYPEKDGALRTNLRTKADCEKTAKKDSEAHRTNIVSNRVVSDRTKTGEKQAETHLTKTERKRTKTDLTKTARKIKMTKADCSNRAKKDIEAHRIKTTGKRVVSNCTKSGENNTETDVTKTHGKRTKTDLTKMAWKRTAEADCTKRAGKAKWADQRGRGSRGDDCGGSPSVHSPAYLHWKRLGAQQGLHEDRDIACFLLKYYEDTSRVLLPAGLTGVCKTCGTPLSISCTGCDWIISADATSTSPHHGASAGDGTEEGGGRGGEGRGGGDGGVPPHHPLYLPPSSHRTPVGIKPGCDDVRLSGDVPHGFPLSGHLCSSGGSSSLGLQADSDDESICGDFDGGGGEGGDMASVFVDAAENSEGVDAMKSEEHRDPAFGQGAQDIEKQEEASVCERERVGEEEGREEGEEARLMEEGVEEDKRRREEKNKEEKEKSDVLAVEDSDSQSCQMCPVIDPSGGTEEAIHLEDEDDSLKDLECQKSGFISSLDEELSSRLPAEEHLFTPVEDPAGEPSSPVGDTGLSLACHREQVDEGEAETSAMVDADLSPSSHLHQVGEGRGGPSLHDGQLPRRYDLDHNYNLTSAAIAPVPSQPQPQATCRSATDEDHRPYKCDICGKTYPTHSNLNRHLKVHSGDKPFMCELCGRAFLMHTDMRRHMLRVHKVQAGYVCKRCGETFRTAASLQMHNKIHRVEICSEHRQTLGNETVAKRSHQIPPGGKLFKCDVCDKSFSYRYRLVLHKKVHSKIKQFICDECGRTFTRLSGLGQHKKCHSPDSFMCDECGKSHHRKTDLTKHKRNHHGADSKPACTCDECGKTFTRKYKLAMHKRSHSGLKPYSCETCGAAFSFSSNLIRHRKIHVGHRPHRCTLCKKAFIQSPSLKEHYMQVHTGLRPFECDVCKKSFTSKGLLRVHSYKHSGISATKIHTCEVCGKGFSQLHVLKMHIFSRHMGKYSFQGMKTHDCKICGKKFAYPFLLRKHMALHNSRNQPISKESFPCETCGRKFSFLGNLRRHWQTHADVKAKPYQCDVCFKVFTQLSSMKNHKIIHTGLRPFECDICKKTFTEKGSLTKHQKIHMRERSAVDP